MWPARPVDAPPRPIHYASGPVFAGVDDPCHERVAVLPGYAEVVVPELAPERLRAAFAAGGGGARLRPAAARVGFKATRSEKYMLACLKAVVDAPPGRRHPTIVSVGARLLGLAKAGRWTPP